VSSKYEECENEEFRKKRCDIVYYCHLPSEVSSEMIARMENISAHRRRQKAANLTGNHKAASLTAGLLYDFAAKSAGIKFGFLPGEKGRPKPIQNGMFTSISHSGRHVACALENRVVGVDVQQSCTISYRVMKRVSSPFELEQIENSNDRQQASRLLWVLKEAYYKAADSVECPVVMRSTNFSIPNTQTKLWHSPISGPKGWEFWAWELFDDAILALCLQADA
jgi:4'-phosphopantetheinyl transferase EntD